MHDQHFFVFLIRSAQHFLGKVGPKDPALRVENWASDSGNGAREPCSFWGAQLIGDHCHCPYGPKRLGTSRFCGEGMVFIDDFNPVSATLGNAGAEMWESKCKCLLNWPEREVEQWDLLQESVVGVNAVDFCSTLFEDFDAQQKITHHSWDRGHLDNKKAFITREVEPKLTTDLCKKKLRDSRKVDLILQGASDSFKKVCQDECEDLVKALRAQTAAIASFGTERFGSYSMACSLYAVKKIESRLLGCCGNSCGWNGKTCTSSDLGIIDF